MHPAKNVLPFPTAPKNNSPFPDSLIFRNFSGEETKYNRKGDRNFCVVIEDPEQAQRLTDDGWNVKVRPANDRYEEPMSFLKVTVNFANIPPKIVMVSGKVKTQLDEESVNELDTAELKRVDLTINPSDWEVNGNSGTKAYLKVMYATLDRDVFASRYEDEELPFN